MRFPFTSSLLLVAAFAAGGAALLNCSAPDAGEEGLTDDEINGASNKMGLRLLYDDASGRVRATVKQKIGTDEQLLMRVRRGHLSKDSQKELDCTDLAPAPAMEPKAGAAGATVYEGPEVDRALLASVYTQDWIDGNITNEMIERVQREGADSIVEACIVKGGQVRARLQTTLQYAWDEADPNFQEDGSTETQSLHVLARDGGATVRRPRSGSPIQSMEKYAELCVAELGEIPFFKKLSNGKYDTFDCRDFVGTSGPMEGVEGALIPQGASNENGEDATPEECDGRDINRYNCFKKCDKPEWLFQSCEPGPTVSTAKNDKGTHWTLLCRSAQVEGGGNETTAKLNKTKHFNDIAMIGHNPKTGKTCYFQNKIFSGTDGANVPHPADVEKSRHIWDGPKGYCASCHSAEAFIHSPWIDGATRSDGTPIVPKMGVHQDFEISWNASPYNIVNRAAMARGRVGDSSWEIPKHLVSEEAEACTSCHRIGGGQGMGRFPMWSIGEEGIETRASGTAGPILGKMTDWAKQFENAHWMPPRAGEFTAETWQTSKYVKAVKHIEACAKDAAAAGCVFKDVPETP